MYSVEKKLSLVKWYLRGLADLFQITYPDRPKPSLATTSKYVQKYKNIGCIVSKHKKKNRPRHVITDAKKYKILQAIANNNMMLFTKSLAQTVNVSKSAVHILL